jgi:ubiquinone/menaquinone biosynthesis C-methylase UbiE
MVSLSKGNAQSLPFATASFDKVICSEVLEHLQDPDIALKEIARVLKPGGRALISIPNEPLINTLKSMFQKLGIFNLLLRREDGYKTSAKMDDEWHLHSFDLEILLKLAATVLQPKSVVRLPLFITPIRYMVEFERK